MNKIIYAILICSAIYSGSTPKYSTTSVVTLVGAKIKSEQIEQNVAKYKRKDCPVCKGKGWYISGDKIEKIDCGYCEPEDKQSSPQPKHKTIISKG